MAIYKYKVSAWYLMNLEWAVGPEQVWNIHKEALLSNATKWWMCQTNHPFG